MHNRPMPIRGTRAPPPSMCPDPWSTCKASDAWIPITVFFDQSFSNRLQKRVGSGCRALLPKSTQLYDNSEWIFAYCNTDSPSGPIRRSGRIVRQEEEGGDTRESEETAARSLERSLCHPPPGALLVRWDKCGALTTDSPTWGGTWLVPSVLLEGGLFAAHPPKRKKKHQLPMHNRK